LGRPEFESRYPQRIFRLRFNRLIFIYRGKYELKKFFPFDEQECPLIFASRDDPIDYVQLKVNRWNVQNQVQDDQTTAHFNETNVETLRHSYFKPHNEWVMVAYQEDVKKYFIKEYFPKMFL